MGDMSKAAERRKAPLQTPSHYDTNAIRDISGALNALLADTFALYLKTKNFHWHMSGPHFRDYHLLLDEQGDQIFAMTDPLAERVRKIGGTTLRSIGDIARLQRVEDNDADYRDAAGHAGGAARRQQGSRRPPARGARPVRRARGRRHREPDRELDRRDRAAGVVPVRSDARPERLALRSSTVVIDLTRRWPKPPPRFSPRAFRAVAKENPMSLTQTDTQVGKTALAEASPRPHRHAHHARRARRLGHRRRRLGRRLGEPGRQAVDRRDPPRGRARRQLDRHRRHLWSRPFRGDRARGAEGDPLAAAARSYSPSAGSSGTRTIAWRCRSKSARRRASAASSRPRCKRLGLERIDLYQMHWPARDGTPIEEYWRTLLDLKAEGKVRAVGLSNHNVAQLEAAEKVGHVDTLQPPFSAIRREFAGAELPWCLAHDTGVIVYSPMQAGLLTGAFTAERAKALPADDWRSRNAEFTGDKLKRNLELAETMQGRRQAAWHERPLPRQSPGRLPGPASAAPSSAPATPPKSMAGSTRQRCTCARPTSMRSPMTIERTGAGSGPPLPVEMAR